MLPDPSVIVLDVNETLSDLSPMPTKFVDVGARICRAACVASKAHSAVYARRVGHMAPNCGYLSADPASGPMPQ